MSKKFDVVIGNPPYQEEAQGEGTRDTPIYHQFMDAAYEVGTKVVLITPARFLFNAGFTPKAWNEKMLADEHLSVAHLRVRLEPSCFRALRTPSRAASPSPTATRSASVGPIGFFTKHPELNTILHKVRRVGHRPHCERSGSRVRARTATRTRCTRTTLRRVALRPEGNAALVNTNAFEQFSFLFHADKPADGDEYVQRPRSDQEQARVPLDSQRLHHRS